MNSRQKRKLRRGHVRKKQVHQIRRLFKRAMRIFQRGMPDLYIKPEVVRKWLQNL